MVNVVEAFDKEIVGFVDVRIQTCAGLDKAARDFAFVRDLFLSKQVRWLFPFGNHAKRLPEQLPYRVYVVTHT